MSPGSDNELEDRDAGKRTKSDRPAAAGPRRATKTAAKSKAAKSKAAKSKAAKSKAAKSKAAKSKAAKSKAAKPKTAKPKAAKPETTRARAADAKAEAASKPEAVAPKAKADVVQPGQRPASGGSPLLVDEPPRFADGAAARRAACATTRLNRPLAVLASQPEAGPSIDPAAKLVPRSRSVLAELRQMEPQVARRLRHEVLQPAAATLTKLANPRTHRRWLSTWRMQRRSEMVDDFGLDPMYAERFRPLFEFLYRRYWRVETEGMTSIPDHGRAIVVANHSGTVPYDAAMLMYAIRYDHPAHRTARPLVEDFVFHFPFLGVAMNRIGGVRASQQNAMRLLADGQLVIVFPEGIKGISKLYRQRYRLQRFGRGGFVKLALQTGAPIIPTAVIGAEETHPLLAKVTWLAKSMGIPYLPVTPTFPLLGPLGALPLPSKWRIVFGEPIHPARDYGDKSAGDRVLVNRVAEEVRVKIQTMIDQGIGSRTSSFFD